MSYPGAPPPRPDTPLAVSITVYDLVTPLSPLSSTRTNLPQLPPSHLASLLNVLGSGVYHSSIQLSLPLCPSSSPSSHEYAFGGHSSRGITGIFALPAGTAAQRMPGLRAYLTVECGSCFGEDWERVFGPKRRRRSAAPQGEKDWAGRSTTALNLGEEGRSTMSLVEDPFRDPGEGEWEEEDGGARDGTEGMTRSERKAWRIMEEMKKEEEWGGTRYQLLGKNCNTFTDELLWRLTGRRAPGWINRAAWVATSLPCLVPEGWIEDADEPGAGESSAERNAATVIVPPRADRMEVGGRRA